VSASTVSAAWAMAAFFKRAMFSAACAEPPSQARPQILRRSGARRFPGPSMKSAKTQLVPLAGLEPARCCHHLILSQIAGTISS
jgi:hypothetical protein